MIRRLRWRGPQPSKDREQVANARDGLFRFAPVSDVPAETTRTNWAATLPGTDPVPLIWEDSRYGYQQQDD